MHARQRMPTGLKRDGSQTSGSSGPLRTRMGSGWSGRRREWGTGLRGALGASIGLLNIQCADSQKSMLIFKTLLPRATLPA